MTKRVTLEQFEAKHPGATWTAKSQRAYDAGEKECTQCFRVLPLSEYGVFLTEHKKKRFIAYCYDCGRQYKHRVKRKRPRTEKARQQELKRYHQNAEKIGFRRRDWYAKNRDENNALILDTDICDVCGGEHAGYFWRRLDSTGRAEWVVLHKSCHEQAEIEGLIPRGARLRKKKELQQ